MLESSSVVADMLAGELATAQDKIAGLNAQLHLAALQIRDGTVLLDAASQELNGHRRQIERLEQELAHIRSSLEAADEHADGWEKVANARAEENAKLRRLIIASDDGVSPE